LEENKLNSEIIFLVEESSEGGYEAKALGYSIYTEAETFEELRDNIKDAVHCHFDDSDLPKMIRIHLVKEEIIPV
jgi:hypothetical protein